jgi:co-chaperonin GroES (HSP10)
MIKASIGYILIKPQEVDKTTTVSGIVLPTSIEPSNVGKAEVIDIGGTIYQYGYPVEPPAKKGDIVIYNKSNSTSFKEEEIKYLFIPFNGVLGIIK